MAKVFVIDIGRCMGCYSCQMACKDEYCGNDWSPYSKPQPETGQFWLKLTEHTNGTLPKIKLHYIPTLCNHCEKPACLDACPNSAISRHEDLGFVIIEPEKCKGCGSCVKACPYGAIYFNNSLNIAQKCTGCAHLLDNGFKLPRCVEACPTDVFTFGEEKDLADLVKGAQPLKPEVGIGPKVYYRNIPGKFIAGTVYDPERKEVIVGARIRATSGGKRVETKSDLFGDFWLNDLPIGRFDVFIEAKGYKLKCFYDIDTENSANLGDVPMEITTYKTDDAVITEQKDSRYVRSDSI